MTLQVHHDDGFFFNADGKLEMDPDYEPPPHPNAIHLVCEMCGAFYQDYDWCYDPRVVALCMRCDSPRRYPRTCVGYKPWREFNAPPGGKEDLIYHQARQIASALMALEARC